MNVQRHRVTPEMQGSANRGLSQLRKEMGVGEPYELADVRQAIAANALTGDYSVSGLARRMADH